MRNGTRSAILLVVSASAALAAFAASGCRGGSRAPATATTPVSGAESFRTRTCWRCHALDRTGTEIGPPLQGLARDWDLDSLTRYIEDPAPFRARDARLQELVGHYGGRLMKGFPIEPQERRALAAWLLADESLAEPPGAH